ncbi:MAG: radical SAM protein [Ruminococcus sp.]|nr:radical SAM protein [Ruminococcus sp.]
MHIIEAKHILSAKNGMNVYRGCTHGCIYCDSRSSCYNFDHDFEDVGVKINAPQLLDAALRSKRKKCMIGTGAMCDPYMPMESKFQITRKCLEVIDRHGFGAAVLTKSASVLRDRDLLRSINEKAKAVVQMTVTTFDDELCRIIEPNVSLTSERFAALEQFRSDGIPTVVWLSPLLPFINDTEENLMGILSRCAELGVKGIMAFGMGLTLREGNREYFYSALDRHFHGLKQRYISTYGNAYILPSPNENRLLSLFHSFCEKYNIIHDTEKCFGYLNELPEKFVQMSFFDV